MLLDRTSSDLDRVLRHLDPDTVSPSDSLPVLTGTQTNTHAHGSSRSNPQRSLAQLLNDIQACRWRYFRPRPLNQNTKEESRPDALQDNRKGRGGTTTVTSGSRNGSSGAVKLFYFNMYNPSFGFTANMQVKLHSVYQENSLILLMYLKKKILFFQIFSKIL